MHVLNEWCDQFGFTLLFCFSLNLFLLGRSTANQIVAISMEKQIFFLFHVQQPGGSGWEVWDNSCCSGCTIHAIWTAATSTRCIIQSYCKLQYQHSSSSCCWNHHGTGKNSSTYAAGRAAVRVLWYWVPWQEIQVRHILYLSFRASQVYNI